MICQSCGMNLREEQYYGKNADGSKNQDYCCYCFIDGKFGKEETMEEMIECCIPFRVNQEFSNVDEVRKSMLTYFPKLKRWKKTL